MSFRVSHAQGAALVFAAGFVWSLNGLALRLVGEAGTWQVLFYRSVGMVPVLFLWVAFTSGGKPWQTIRSAGMAGVIGGLGLVFAFAGAIYSMQVTSIANAVFLFAAAPLMTAAMARPLLGEYVRPVTWIAIAIAAVGIFLMVRQGLALGAGMGNFAALASAAGFSAFTLSLRRAHLTDMTPAVLIGASLAIIVSALVIWLRAESFALPLRGWGIAVLMGAILLAGGMALFTIGARVVPAAEVGLLSLIEVMLGPVWVWLILNETTSRDTLIGGAVLLAAIVLNTVAGTGGRHAPKSG
jgi:drug/metabolite transporter, DME family